MENSLFNFELTTSNRSSLFLKAAISLLKESILSLSNEIAALRNREDLFEVVNSKLKRLFSITEFGIAQINEDDKTYSAFILDLKEPIVNDVDFKRVTTDHYDITDPLFS